MVLGSTCQAKHISGVRPPSQPLFQRWFWVQLVKPSRSAGSGPLPNLYSHDGSWFNLSSQADQRGQAPFPTSIPTMVLGSTCQAKHISGVRPPSQPLFQRWFWVQLVKPGISAGSGPLPNLYSNDGSGFNLSSQAYQRGQAPFPTSIPTMFWVQLVKPSISVPARPGS